MENASSEDVKKMGIDFATRQCEDLSNNGIHYFHFYTLNHSKAVTEIIHNINLDKKCAALSA